MVAPNSCGRDRNGYRLYGDDTVPLVTNLRRLLSAGLSLTDIQRFRTCLTSPDMGTSPCVSALGVYEQRMQVLDEQLAALTQVRRNLAAAAHQLRSRIEGRRDHLPGG
jgi:DNA-binding transcriptional MerR regulator